MRGEPKGVIFHSDRGAQYTSYEYFSLLKALNVIQSYLTLEIPMIMPLSSLFSLI